MKKLSLVLALMLLLTMVQIPVSAAATSGTVDFFDGGTNSSVYSPLWGDTSKVFTASTITGKGSVYANTAGEKSFFYNFETPVSSGKLIVGADVCATGGNTNFEFLARDVVNNDSERVGSAGNNTLMYTGGGGSYARMAKGHLSAIAGAVADSTTATPIGVWTRMDIVVDLDAHTRSLYVNGKYIQTQEDYHITKYNSTEVIDTIYGLGVYSNTTNEDSILYVDNVRIATIPTTNVAATKMDNNIEITFPNTVVGGVANISASDITVQKVADRSVTVPVTGVSVSESNGLVLATDGFANGEYCIKFKNTVTTIAGEEIDEIYFDAFGLIQEPVVNFIDDGSKATAWGTNWNDPANMFDEATEDSAYGKIYKSTSGEDDMFFNFETPVKPGGKLVFSADYKSSDYYARVQFLVRDRVDNDKQMVGSAGKNAVALALGGGASNSYVVLLKGNHSSIDGAIKDPNKNLVATNAWTKIKLVLDLEKHTRELYVNDVFVQSDSNWHVTEYGTSNITDTIWGIGIHCFPPANYGGGDSSIACLDNISITAYNTESSIKARFVDLSGVEHAPNTTLPVDINAVKIYAGAEGLTADDFAGATLGGVSLAGGTFADGVYTKDLGGILDPTTAYTLSVPAISTMPAYTTTFTTRAGEFRVDSLKIVKPDGSAIALNEVTAGTQLKLVVEAVNTTGITQTPVMLYGVYNDGFFKQADIKALSFESVGPVSDSITFTVEDATELQVKGFLWENMNTMMPYISAVEL